MSGFDRKKFVNLSKEVEEEMSCGICLNILNNPMTTPCCRHSYCYQCINQWLDIKKSCPNDRTPLLKHNLIKSSRNVTNLLDRQEVYCDHKPNGCQQIVHLSQLSQHLIDCSFDPNRAYDKCDQILCDIESSVDILKKKNKNPNLNQTFAQLKSQISECRHGVNVLNSNLVSVEKKVYIQPNTENFKYKIMESAKNNIENPHVIHYIMSENLKNKILIKSKEAINSCNNYEEIAGYLVQALNNELYEWSAFVYPINSIKELIGRNASFKIELSFGDLCILLISHHKDEDNEDDEEDDDQDYEDGDEYDDESDYTNDSSIHWVYG